MMKATLIVLLSVASTTYGGFLTKKFAYTQVMANCVGEKFYYDWLADVMTAKKACYHEPMKLHHNKDGHKQMQQGADLLANLNLAQLLQGDRSVILPLIIPQNGQSPRFQIPYNLLANNRQKREVIYEAPLLKKMLKKAKAKVGNLTCVLEKLDIIDAEWNLKIDTMKADIATWPVDAVLKKDLVEVVDHCDQLSMCLPEKQSPMPIGIKRAMAFMKCHKKGRMAICMKKDIMKYLEIFDVSGLPFETEEDEEIAEKLLHIFWGVEAKEDFQVY